MKSLANILAGLALVMGLTGLSGCSGSSFSGEGKQVQTDRHAGKGQDGTDQSSKGKDRQARADASQSGRAGPGFDEAGSGSPDQGGGTDEGGAGMDSATSGRVPSGDDDDDGFLDGLLNGLSAGRSWQPDTPINDLLTLERCKMDIMRQTGDFSLCMRCFEAWQQNGGTITPKECGCYQETVPAPKP